MSINFNKTLPAAPAGSTNVTFQNDGAGNMSAYVSTPNALPASTINLTAQVADISAANLVATPTAGLYRISAYIVVTQASGTTSLLPAIVITWQDQDGGTSQSLTLTPTNAGNVLTDYEEAVGIVSANTSAIQYATSGYASVGSPVMKFAIRIRVESL